jgi:hypothetical protein
MDLWRKGHQPAVRQLDKQCPAAELLAALSLAMDLGNGFVPETALRSSLLAVQLGQELGLRDSDFSDVYYLPLLAGNRSTPGRWWRGARAPTFHPRSPPRS